MFSSLVLSRLTYASSSCTSANGKEEERFSAAVSRLYKRLHRCSKDEHISNIELCAALELPSGDILIRRERLRYLGSLYKCASLHLWAILLMDSQWKTLILEDLDWLWGQVRHTSSLPDPRQDQTPWEDILYHHPRYWKKLIRRAVSHHIRQQHIRSAGGT